ncbi:MAG TPA: hypothetical protein VEZ55_17155 [Chitinophagaceae bacterium]|jgi:hypothetical protein|nr:hypothetical protein [Chitinophagaceae bacterium]
MEQIAKLLYNFDNTKNGLVKARAPDEDGGNSNLKARRMVADW